MSMSMIASTLRLVEKVPGVSFVGSTSTVTLSSYLTVGSLPAVAEVGISLSSYMSMINLIINNQNLF